MLYSLAPETAKSWASFQSVNNVHRSDLLATSMFGVGNGITNNVIKEHLQIISSYFVNKASYTLHTTMTRWLCYALYVISKDFAVAPPFPSFPLSDFFILLWFAVRVTFFVL